VRKALLVGLALAVALVAFAAVLPSLRVLIQGAPEVPVAPPTSLPSILPSATPTPLASPSPSPSGVSSSGETRELKILGKKPLDTQIAIVVGNMDRTGRPPSGVAQGGRKGSRSGVFQNAERRLPVRAPGYYKESDVWPRRAGARGAERLVFGREGEVYFSPDHYRSFVRLR
jgi:guanyl-specific ribonuclease Sa